MPMASNTKTRASDADRDRAAAALREHLAAGRLTLEEFDQRLDQAYAAKTLGDLDEVMTDLPETDLDQLPDAPVNRPGASPLARRRPPGSIEARPGRFSPAWRAAWGSWLAISLFLLVIWLASGASGGPWFVWVALALGAMLLGRWITGAPARSERRPARRIRRHRDDDPARQREGPWLLAQHLTGTTSLDAAVPGTGAIVYGGNPSQVTGSVTGIGTVTRG
jgi:hypothetical protein